MPLCIRVDQARTFLFYSNPSRKAAPAAQTYRKLDTHRAIPASSPPSHSAERTAGNRAFSSLSARPLPSRRCGDGLRRRESSVGPSHTLRASADRGAALKAAEGLNAGI